MLTFDPRAFTHLCNAIPDFTDNNLINIIRYGDEYYASSEVNYINQIDPITLETLGRINYRNHITLNLATAHPHYDEEGNTYNMGTAIMGWSTPRYVILRVPARTSDAEKKRPALKQLERICSIPCRSSRSPGYFHSFGMTQSYLLFVEQPFKLDILKLASAYFRGVNWGSCLKFHEDDVVSDAMVVFHHINAYEEGDHVVMDLISYKDSSLYQMFYLDNMKQETEDILHTNQSFSPPTCKRFILPLTVDKISEPGSGSLMVSYVDCLTTEHAGSVVGGGCWRGGGEEEDRDELLPRKMASMRPRTDGSLRRRLLSARIAQRHDLWPNHAHHPSNPAHPPSNPAHHPSNPAPQTYLGKQVPPTLLQPRPLVTPPAPHRSAYSSLSQWRRTSCVPPSPPPPPGVQRAGSPPSVPLHARTQTSPICPKRTAAAESREERRAGHAPPEEPNGRLESTQKPQRSRFLLLGSKPFSSVDDVRAEVTTPQGSQSCGGEWPLPLPLPTPEERMRQHAQAVPIAIVPINITGESFVRQASSRQGGVANSDSPGRRPHQLRCRKTVTGIRDDIIKIDLGPVYGVLPGQYSTVGRPGPTIFSQTPPTSSQTPPTSSRTPLNSSQTPPTSRRRIRAQKGEGICSLMASLTSQPPSSCLPHSNTSSSPSPSSCLPLLPTSSSTGLDSERRQSTSYRWLHSCSSTSCCCSQGSHGDLQPLLPFNHPCSPLVPRCSSSSSLNSSLSGWESPLASCLQVNQEDHHPPTSSSSSTQRTSSVDGETWAYQPLLPQGTSSVSREARGFDPLLSDSSSICSEGSVSSHRGPGTKGTISLRKALRPPVPPCRSDSLAARPRDPPQPPHNPTSDPKDPWVPRLPTRRRSGVTTFDPAGLPRSMRDYRGRLDPEFPNLELWSLGSRELDPLASPSSGYSSQSNTPTPGTPLSSPFSSSSSPLPTPCSSRPHSDRPGGVERSKPPVPERKSSLRSQSSLTSFKALLLKTGSPACTASRISAVERLCTSSSPISPRCTSSSSHQGPQGITSPDVPLPGYGSAPPCSSSRRFTARFRLPAFPLIAILEEEEKEEEEEEEEAPCQGLAVKAAQQLVNKQEDYRIHYSLGVLGRPVQLLSLPLMESSM
ncbi:unnamed protein product [Merluccius merluccius]